MSRERPRRSSYSQNACASGRFLACGGGGGQMTRFRRAVRLEFASILGELRQVGGQLPLTGTVSPVCRVARRAAAVLFRRDRSPRNGAAHPNSCRTATEDGGMGETETIVFGMGAGALLVGAVMTLLRVAALVGGW